MELDTLLFRDRTGGELDSVDIANSLRASTMDGARFALGPNDLMASRFYTMRTQPVYFSNYSEKRLRFSALPRIGFHYSFGAQGTQFFHANYTQSYNRHLILNLDYNRNASNNYVRNSAFEQHQLRLRLNGTWNKYAFSLLAGYGLDKTDYSGGLFSDTLIENFGLEFMPVNKSDANSRSEFVDIRLTQFVNFGDSSIRYGLKLENGLEVLNRKYWENDTIFGIYTNYTDSFATYDQYNLPRLNNAAGLFFSNSNLYVDAVVHSSYWEYQNTGLYTDTTELGIQSELTYQKNRLRIRNNMNFNLFGNFNQWTDDFSFSYALNSSSSFQSKFSVGQLSPLIHQRHYRSNNFSYHLDEILKMGRVEGSVDYTYKLKDSLGGFFVGTSFLQLNNPYVWNDSLWSNAKYDEIRNITVDLGFKIRWKSLYMQSNLRLNISDNNFLPLFTYSGRLYIKKPVFEAQKMKILFGAEPQFFSSIQQQTFLPAMDAFYWNSDPLLLPSLFNLHVFGGFEIDEFRFYLRMEELGWLWNDRKRQDVTAYPLAGMRFRVGVTWDFFN